MKKLFFLLVIPFSLIFNSCLDTGKETYAGVEQGVAFYEIARPQADMDIDPLLLALKLNTLIYTADEAGESYSTVKVSIGEGDDKKEVVLVDRLFGSSNTVTKSGNEWTLKFTSTTRDDKEKHYRIGEMTINTNGYGLEDLAADPSRSWDISIPDAGYEMVFYTGAKYINKMTYCTITAADEGDNTFTLEGHSTSYREGGQEYAANWNFSYELTIPAGQDFLYGSMAHSMFYLDADILGKPCDTPANFQLRYTAVDLKYKPECSLTNIFGGIEYVEVFNRTLFPLTEYPELKVKYSWFDRTSTTPCLNSVEISYDGITVTV